MARFLIGEVVEAARRLEQRERPFTRKALAAELGVPIELADQSISNALEAGHLRCVGYSGPIPRYAVDGGVGRR